ncbi:hypothetical protein CYY_003515 [Polysphondylium violaceum]|uniref:EGF-like domain-containing protein n=1 Tax=Polysphondylium violaceum TaxID=133409 RepID=A0A8J4V5U8_9MYCE|nr:hypothetical protein CYY_003515 [Polysphondylium violaceum]
MKFSKSLLCSLLLLSTCLLSSTLGADQQCSDDYQCGNFPQAACAGKLNLIPGIGLNEQTGKVLIAGKYNSTHQGPFGYPYILSVPIGGGSIQKEYPIKVEIPAGSGYTSVDELFAYLPVKNLMYLRLNKGGSPVIGVYDSNTANFSQVWNIFNTPLEIAFNEQKNQIIYSAYGIYRLNYIPTSKPDYQDTQQVYYQSQLPNGLSNQGEDLYMSTYSGNFYKGLTTCNACPETDLKLLFSDPEGKSITGFTTSPTHMYYSSPNGIFEVPLAGNISMKRALVSDNVVAMVISSNGFIYYTTAAGEVKSVSLAGNHPQVVTLYTSSVGGTCQCAVGFTGDKCQTCQGTILWNDGYPYCYPLVDNKPSTCFYSYQCGEQPYNVCAGSCICASNFTGPDCKTCAGTVEWSNGNAICKL